MQTAPALLANLALLPRLLVRPLRQLLGLGDLVGAFHAHLQVAGPEVADMAYVAAEVAVIASRRVERQIQEDVLGVYLEAAEVARRAEGDVELDRRGDDVVAEPAHVLVELVGDDAQLALGLGEVVFEGVDGGTQYLPLAAALRPAGDLLPAALAYADRAPAPDQLDRQVLASEDAILPELDVGADRLDGVGVVVAEVLGDAEHARRRPVDGHIRAERPLHEQLEVAAMVDQPVEVVERLVDHRLVAGELVLDDHRRAVLIESQAVDAARVLVAGRELGGKEADAVHLVEVGLKQPLDLTLELERRALERLQFVGVDLEEIHGLLSDGRRAFLDEGDLVGGEAVQIVD